MMAKSTTRYWDFFLLSNRIERCRKFYQMIRFGFHQLYRSILVFIRKCSNFWNLLIKVQGSSPRNHIFFPKKFNIWKCYLDYSLVTMVKVEVIGAYISAINTFLSKTSFIIISIMFFLLFLAFVLPGIKKSLHLSKFLI